MSALLEADLRMCRARLAGGSRSFLLASHLLPRPVAESATVFYAFCRVADDAIDDAAGDPGALGELRARLAALYAGQPWDRAEDRALAAVVRRHGVPRPLLEALLEGFQWDAEGRSYASVDDLEHYAARVAGSVGVVMALLMGERDDVQLARAAELGIAMQLTNICRDVADDAALGRLYLPAELLTAHGLDPRAWLAEPVCTPAVRQAVATLLARAGELYAGAAQGVRRLPWRCRPGIRAALLLYQAIGDELEERSLDPFLGRARVPTWRQLQLLARSLLPVADDPERWWRPPPAAARFLVESAAGSAREPAPAGRAQGRVAFLVQLFLRLQERAPCGVRVESGPGG